MQQINCKFTINSRGAAQVWDTHFTIQRPYHRLQFRPKPPSDAILISFAQGNLIHASDCFFSIDSPGSAQHHIPPNGLEQSFTNISFILPTASFLMTDVIATDAQGNSVPLYYCHRLPLSAAPNTEVHLLRPDMSPLREAITYIYRTSSDFLIFNNLSPELRKELVPCGAIYVNYIDAYNCPQYVLLNNQPAYRELPIEEYDTWHPSQRFYRLRDVGHGFLVEVLFDPVLYNRDFHHFSVLIPPDAFGHVVLPTTANMDSLWYLRLKWFDYYYAGAQNHVYRYRLSDYQNQNFIPHQPYKKAVRVKGHICNSYLIQAPHRDLIILPEQGLHLEILVYTPDNKLRMAGHTDTSKIVFYNEQQQPTGVRYLHDYIATYSEEAGLIHINYPVEEDEAVLLTYHFKDDYLDYSLLNLNPRLQPEVINHEYLLCLMPVEQIYKFFNIYCDGSSDAQNDIIQLTKTFFGSDAVQTLVSSFNEDFWRTSRSFIIDTTDTNKIDLEDETFLEQLHLGCIIFTTKAVYEHISNNLPVGEEERIGTSPLRVRQLYKSYIVDAIIPVITIRPTSASYEFKIGKPALQPEEFPELGGWFGEPGWFESPWFDAPELTILPPSVELEFAPGKPTLLKSSAADEIGYIGTRYKSLSVTLQDYFYNDIMLIWDTYSNKLLNYYRYYPRLFHIKYSLETSAVIEHTHPYLDLSNMPIDEFFDNYTVAGKNTHQYIVLWHGGVGLPSSAYQLEWVDCRQRGGGLKDTIDLQSIAQSHPQLYNVLDVIRCDGRPMPGAGAIVIELPHTLLKEYGGFLNAEDLLVKVQQFLGAGIYPVLRFYGQHDPELTSWELEDGTLTLTWKDTGGPYSVYVGSTPDTITLFTITTSSSVTITPLPASDTCTVLITPVRDNAVMTGQVLWNFKTA